ncbi:MAG: hypothetical protein IKK85_04435 [Clostridia bacterium]|nr:hypothetical protein [Clostridia bacterium]
MLQLSQEQCDEFLRKRAFALSQFEEGASIKEILKSLYIESMESKSDEQAELMAEEIVEKTDMFFSFYDSLNDAPGNLAEKIDLALSELEPAEKAKMLLQASCVFENISSLAENGKFEKEPEQLTVDGIDEATVNTLLERTVAAMQDEKTAEILLGIFADQSREAALGNAFIENRNDPKTMVAVESMIIYTMAVNNRAEGIPKSTTLAQITLGVCLDNALRNIANDQGVSAPFAVILRKVAFVLASVLIVAATSAAVIGLFIAAGFVGIEAFLVGALCVLFYASRFIMLAHESFCITESYALDTPVVVFPRSSHEVCDRIKSKIHSAKQASEQKRNTEVDDNILQNDDFTDRLYNELFDDTIPLY